MKRALSFSAAALGAMLALGFLCAARALPAADTLIDASGADASALLDQNRSTKRSYADGAALTLSCAEPADALYLIWDAPYPAEGWSLLADGRPVALKGHGFLHEYIALDAPAQTFVLSWEGPATLCDVYVLRGETPDWVQIWRPAEGEADLLLLPTHADDEHLFFGGIMPLYAADGRYEIQVAYMVNHNTEPYRPHELLNGLWTVGVTRYPVIPDFPDLYSDSLEHARTIYNEEQILAYQVGLINRFKPQVIVGHDLNGEYGHGAHMLNAHTLLQAVEKAAALPDGWDTPKTYLHLYPEKVITLHYGEPLPRFAGRTALEMARDGFACHISQQTYFSVEDFGPYDCRKFGLARIGPGVDYLSGETDLFAGIRPRDLPDLYPVYISPPPAGESSPAPAPEPVFAPPPEARNDFVFAVIGHWKLWLAGLAALAAAVFWMSRRR